MSFVLSLHATREAVRRQIPKEVVLELLRKPEQILTERDGLRIYQSRIDFPNGRTYLVRAVVDEEQNPMKVLTVYRTSKITKYWRES